MANNRYDKVYLDKTKLNTIANGGTIINGSDTYNADESSIYMTDDTSVLYEEQTLTAEQKAQARNNIGAGTSSFSGSYNDLTDKPTIPTDTGATSVEVTGSGNAIDSASYDSSTRKLTLTKGITAITQHQDISGKQDKTDNSLQTSATTVVGAINEVNSLAKEANKAEGYASYSALITALNSASATDYNVGQSFYIQTLEVPDLWIISVESTSSSYTYTTDSAFITATGASGGQQVGYYKIAQLETQKVDLTNYSTKSETVSNISYDSTNKKLQKTINGTTSDVVAFGVNAFTNTTIPTSASDVGALPSSTKYAASLSISGRSVQLKDQNGNNLGTAMTTQDTTYESKQASSGGTDVSLVTTGEKYTWNNKSNFSGSYNDLTNKPTIPSATTSINGLSGGKLTSPLQISGGDAVTASKIALDQTASGQITDGATGTLFGFLSNNATTLTVGGNSYALNLRGSGTRPQYKGNNLALYSDVPTNYAKVQVYNSEADALAASQADPNKICLF